MELVSLCDSMEVKRGQGWRKPPIDTVRLLLSWFNLDQDLILVLFIVSFSSTPSSTGKSFSLNIIGVVGLIFFRTKIDQTNFDVPPHFPPVCKKETHIPIKNKLEYLITITITISQSPLFPPNLWCPSGSGIRHNTGRYRQRRASMIVRHIAAWLL